MKRLGMIGVATLALGLTTLAPVDTVNLLETKKVEASALATPLPVDLPLEYISGTDGSGLNRGQFKINLGNRKGTLVIKLYITDKAYKNWTETMFADVAKGRHAGFGLFGTPTAFGTRDNQLAAFDRYSVLYEQNPDIPLPKYTSGFQDVGVNKQGERFIALGLYIDKVVNNGIYYLDYPSMTTGWWEAKAYFYENVNVEKRLFNEVDRYFPLLDKVRWGVAELKHKQIGRLTMLKDTPLLKESNSKFTVARTLKENEQYRIYGYKEINGKGYYAVGGGYFVEKNSTLAKYETPAKNKLRLLQILHEE